MSMINNPECQVLGALIYDASYVFQIQEALSEDDFASQKHKAIFRAIIEQGDKGDVFTIAGVNAVNPQTRLSTGSLQQFVVTAAQTASGGDMANMAISPPMYTAANALATIDAFPANNAAVTFVGTASTAYPQNLIYHKDAITLATADLLLPQGVDMASRQVHNGISLRIVRQYDINNDRMPCRVDVLYGFAAIRPVTAVRLWG